MGKWNSGPLLDSRDGSVLVETPTCFNMHPTVCIAPMFQSLRVNSSSDLIVRVGDHNCPGRVHEQGTNRGGDGARCISSGHNRSGTPRLLQFYKHEADNLAQFSRLVRAGLPWSAEQRLSLKPCIPLNKQARRDVLCYNNAREYNVGRQHI